MSSGLLEAALARLILPPQHPMMLLTPVISPSLATPSLSLSESANKYLSSAGFACGQACERKDSKSSADMDRSGSWLSLQYSPRLHMLWNEIAHNGLFCRSAVMLGVRTFETGSPLILIVALAARPTVVVVDDVACGMPRAPFLSAIRLRRI